MRLGVGIGAGLALAALSQGAFADETCSSSTGDVVLQARTPEVDLFDGPSGKKVMTLEQSKFPACAPITGRAPNFMLQVAVNGNKYWVPPYMVRYRFSGKLPAVCRNLAMGSNEQKVGSNSGPRRRLPQNRRIALMRARGVVALAAGLLAAVPVANASVGDGYPSRGTALQQLSPATDYSDVLKGRPLALGIMRARAQGFVPSPQLQTYVQGVMLRLLVSVKMPPSFRPEVRVLAAPEFAGECTPDGTLIITVGLLEQLENEDELAFVLGHELGHAIYRHQSPDWYKKAQYYAVVNGGAVDTMAKSAAMIAGGETGNNIMRGLDVAQHLAKLSSNVLMPQMERGQEDAADALGYDLMIKAGYDPEAALSVMDKLAAQEAEAAAAAAQARAAKVKDSGGGGDKLMKGLNLGVGALGSILSGSAPSSDQMADIAIFAFDAAVDNMAEDATAHHPAKEREDLLSTYAFREYRNVAMVNPTPLPWSTVSKSPLKPQLTTLLSHYSLAENAAAYVADQNQGNAESARAYVASSTANPTADHAYTEFVAAEYYELGRQAPLSEAALAKAANGPEPSWEVYSRLSDIYVARGDYGKAQALMDQAVVRFENSPVLLPKRIEILRGAGRQNDAEALVPQCRKYDIDELTGACKKAAGRG